VGVLPVIGRARVGKSTLVEHVCLDERVRSHFSLIVFLGDGDTKMGSNRLIWETTA
jgi:GTPase SAR1 family protein